MVKNEDVKKTSDDETSATKPDWKKKKVGDDERLTLRIDALEAEKYRDRKSKAPQAKTKKTGKISKKVRQLYEEDEDQEDDIEDESLRSLRELRLGHNDASNGDATLIDSLSPSEKRMLEQNTNLEILRREENAGRTNALEQADKLLRQAGLQKMTSHEQMKHIESAIYNPRELKAKALEKNIEKQTSIKGEIEPSKEKDVVRGVKKIMDTTDNIKVSDVKIKDAEQVSKKDLTQNETAELILKKSGQTAKLEDLKMRSAYTQNKELSNINNNYVKDIEISNNSEKQNTVKKKEPKKSYSAEMKDLLKETLRKNNKVR